MTTERSAPHLAGVSTEHCSLCQCATCTLGEAGAAPHFGIPAAWIPRTWSHPIPASPGCMNRSELTEQFGQGLHLRVSLSPSKTTPKNPSSKEKL